MSRRQLRTTCRRCGARLKTYERPEGFCDNCLRTCSLRPIAAGEPGP